ncbi:MAG: DUF4202 family protein [Nitrospinales bacterium]
MNPVESAKRKIRKVIAGSRVPEDPRHAENTLEWLLKLAPTAGPALRLAALAHDIDRAVEARKVQRGDFADYDAFKAAHARNGAKILREILNHCRVPRTIAEEACRLVTLHEVGGDAPSDLLRDADAISYFDVNLPHYFARHGWEETRARCLWGYRRLSQKMRLRLRAFTFDDGRLTRLVQSCFNQQEPEGGQGQT